MLKLNLGTTGATGSRFYSQGTEDRKSFFSSLTFAG